MNRPDDDRRVFFLLDRAGHRYREQLELICREELGVTAAHLGALLHLARNDGVRASELALALHVQPAAVTGLADRMIEAGLVRRRPCPDDARAKRLYLTAAGKRAVSEARPIIARANQWLAERFTREELAVVGRFLAAVADFDLDDAPTLPAGVRRDPSHPGAKP